MEKTQISMEKTTDHLEKPSSLCPSLHRQCEFKSPQIRATQAVSRDQKKENWHLLFVLSPPGSIEKIQPKEPNPAFQVNILRKKKKKLIWYWKWQYHLQPSWHSFLCLPSGAVGQSPTCPGMQEPASAPRGVSQAPTKRLLFISKALLWGRPAEAPDAYLAVIALHMVVFVHWHNPNGLLGALLGKQREGKSGLVKQCFLNLFSVPNLSLWRAVSPGDPLFLCRAELCDHWGSCPLVHSTAPLVLLFSSSVGVWHI